MGGMMMCSNMGGRMIVVEMRSLDVGSVMMCGNMGGMKILHNHLAA